MYIRSQRFSECSLCVKTWSVFIFHFLNKSNHRLMNTYSKDHSNTLPSSSFLKIHHSSTATSVGYYHLHTVKLYFFFHCRWIQDVVFWRNQDEQNTWSATLEMLFLRNCGVWMGGIINRKAETQVERSSSK